MIDNSVSSLAEEIPAISTHENDVRHMSKDFQPSDVSGRLHVVAKKVPLRRKKRSVPNSTATERLKLHQN